MSSSSSVSTNAWKLGTKSLRMSLVAARTLHCGHRPPFFFFLRSSHCEMQACPKTCPHARDAAWCGPEMAQGSRHTVHATASSGGGCLCEPRAHEAHRASPSRDGTVAGLGRDDAASADARADARLPAVPA